MAAKERFNFPFTSYKNYYVCNFAVSGDAPQRPARPAQFPQTQRRNQRVVVVCGAGVQCMSRHLTFFAETWDYTGLCKTHDFGSVNRALAVPSSNMCCQYTSRYFCLRAHVRAGPLPHPGREAATGCRVAAQPQNLRPLRWCSRLFVQVRFGNDKSVFSGSCAFWTKMSAPT